jgi:tRNA pseudouridine38-40 synthase
MPALPSASRRLKLLLEYSGTRYHGWQVQPNAVTIQGTLEACLARLTNAPVRLHAAGRTDAGVHALGQVAHFDSASTIALPALVRGANSLLSSDIVVRQAEGVAMHFHARYSARRKTYAYIVHNHSVPSALQAPYAWHVPQALALPAMRAAARVLLGRHDFSAFRAASCSARDPWRCLFCLRIVRHAERLVFVLNADGFLQHMARTIVGTLVAIGRAQLPADAMATILQSGQRRYAGPTAPAHGLFLMRVVYDTEATVRA